MEKRQARSWRENLIDIQPYTAGEQPKTDGVIKLNANENPYPPAPGVEAVLRSFRTDLLRKYPSSNSEHLCKITADYYNLEPRSVFVSNGSDETLALAFRGFFNSDKPVLFPDVTYSFYPVWCKLFNIPYKLINTDEQFNIHPEHYFIDNGGVIIANPNAPTGISLNRTQIELLLDNNKQSIVIVDEAYVDFGGDSVINLINKYETLLIIKTLSKSRSLAGLRVGFALGNPELISVLTAVKNSFNSYPVDALAQSAAAAALLDETYFRKRIDQIIAVREKYKRELESLGFYATKSRANFLFVSHKSAKAEAIQQHLKEKGILIRRFDAPRIANYLRITIGTEPEMDELTKQISEFLDG